MVNFLNGKTNFFKAFAEFAYYFIMKTKSDILNLFPYFFFPLKMTDNGCGEK